MLPIRLEIQAFGSFAEHETIDFEPYFKHHLLLINGPTGAGKTTILDAISFSLYGETTGQLSTVEGRQVKSLRSDYARGDCPSYVVFVFQIGDLFYKVERKLPYLRPKKRGEGYVEVAGEASLVVCSSKDFDRPKVLEGRKPSTVSKMIMELIGLDAEQFKQIVILPQGQFQRFLLGDSQKKEKILTQLFDTNLLGWVTTKLKQDESECRSLVEKSVTELNTLYKANLLRDRKELENRIALVSFTVLEITGMLPEKKEEVKNNESKLSSLLEIEKTFLDLIEVEKHLTAHLEGTAHINDLRSRLVNSERANQIFSQINELEKLKDQLATKKLERSTIESDICATRDEVERLSGSILSHEDYTKKITEFTFRIDAIRKVKEKISSLKELSRKKSEAESILFSLNEKLEKNSSYIQKIDLSLEDFQSIEASHSREILEIERNLEAWPDLFFLEQASEQLRSNSVQWHALSEEVEKLRDSQRALQNELESLREKQIAAEKNIESAVIDQMKRDLKEGDTCPVCSSTVSRLKMKTGGAAEEPSEEELQSEIMEKKELDSKILSVREALSAAEGKILLREEKLSMIGEQNDSLLENLKSKGVGKQEELEGFKDQVKAAKENLKSLKEKQLLARRKFDNARNEKDKIHKDIHELKIEQMKLGERVGDLLRRERELEVSREETHECSRLSHLEEELSNFRLDHEKGAERLTLMKQRKSELDLSFARLSTEIASIQRTADEKELALVESLRSLQLSEDEVLNMRLTQMQHEEMDAQIKSYDEKLQGLSSTAKHLNRKLKSGWEGSLEELQTQCSECERKLHDDRELLTYMEKILYAKKDELGRLESLFERAKSLHQSLDHLEEKYQTVAHLYRVFSGQTGEKVSFQRYALSVIFDDILMRATRILQQLTSGRYSLERRFEKKGTRGAFGLEIDVFDDQTARTRAVSTLSGGETFLASLALALGLVETLRDLGRGIFIDMLFIDEGFGSLDEASLESVMDVLLKIGSFASVVGIITHVEQMKTHIDARLDVIKTARGSRIESVC